MSRQANRSNSVTSGCQSSKDEEDPHRYKVIEDGELAGPSGIGKSVPVLSDLSGNEKTPGGALDQRVQKKEVGSQTDGVFPDLEPTSRVEEDHRPAVDTRDACCQTEVSITLSYFFFQFLVILILLKTYKINVMYLYIYIYFV